MVNARDTGYFFAKLFVAMQIAWMAGAACLSAADKIPATESSNIVRKVVRQYALTSANDFQQRDPQDWRLLASNDGGKTWVTLDRRTGETFAERHQRRIFQIANTNAYNLYRLQIDLVRDVTAYSVQLAEVELYGDDLAASDLVPIFFDTITARGDNPPVESVAQLFDRRTETKWLDRPPDQKTCASWIQWQYNRPGDRAVDHIRQLRELQMRAMDGFRVEIEGVIADVRSEGRQAEVIDGTGSLMVESFRSSKTLHPGQRVRVEGVSEWRNGQVGVGDCRIEMVGAGQGTEPRAIGIAEPLESSDNFQWVEVEGAIEFVRRVGEETFFDLQQGDQRLRVQMPNAKLTEPLPKAGSRVRVTGICEGGFNEAGQWVPVSLRGSDWDHIGPGSASGSETNAFHIQTAAGFRPIGELRSMELDELRAAPSVKIRGVITSVLGMILQDGSGAIQVVFDSQMGRGITEPGDYVELEGRTGVSHAKTPLVVADRILKLAKGKLPAPRRPTWGQLISGRMDSQWIEMEGVVRATDGAHLLLNCDGRQVTASINAASVPVVKRLVNAAVRVRGVGLAALDDWGRVQGVHLLIPSLEYVEIQQSPQEPFSQPVQPIRSILALSQPEEFLHQVSVEGILTLQDGHRLFVQDETGSAMAIFKEDVVLDPRFGTSRWSFWRASETNAPLPASMRFSPGDRVRVVGFLDTRGYSPVLTEVSVRKTGVGKPVVHKPVVGKLPDWKLDAALVELDAMLLARVALGSHIVLELLWEGRTLQALMPSEGVDLDVIAPGTFLRVTGIWQVDTVPYSELGRRVASVRILPRSPADLVVLSRPSWWTVEHALAVIGGMALILLAASVWIRQLHRQVEQRSIQLTAEIGRREGIERQRALQEERARIAQDLHDDLGAALTQIRFLSAVESRDAAVPENTRSQLRKVSEKSRHLVASLDEIVWAINPANDFLPSLVNYLSHVAEEFFSTTTIRCRLDIDDNLPSVGLTSEMRHNVYLAFREALNNVAKHSGATEVWLRFHWRENALHLSIEDNGRGYAEENFGKGEGLVNMRRRLEKIGGRFESRSDPGTGTICRIWLPFK